MALLALLVVLTPAVTSSTVGAAPSPAATPVSTVVSTVAEARSGVPADPRIGRTTCELLGRAWVSGDPGGCSRTRCEDPGDFVRYAPNAEVCARGGSLGPRFGTFVDSRTCTALHRTWVAVVNVCVSNPRRGLDTVAPGPGCLAPYSTYVTHTEAEGDFDECLRPGRVASLQKIAARLGRPFRDVASERSKTLCSYRYGMTYRDGVCVPAPDGAGRRISGGTAVIGDSVTWRAADELSALRPSWTLDGVPGRGVGDLGERLEHYLELDEMPATVVVALGTNPTRGWTSTSYLDAVDELPDSTRVVFVTPYRSLTNNSAEVVAALTRYTGWMEEAADERPRTCVAEWGNKAMLNPGLLIDGTHQTTPGERVWARFVANAVDACVAENPKVRVPAPARDPRVRRPSTPALLSAAG